MPKNDYIREISEFYNLVFPKLKSFINRAFLEDLKKNKGNLTEDPALDIETIAKNHGITDIQRIPPGMIDDGKIVYYIKHAILVGTVIFLNINDSPEKQRFSIAHEIFHFLLREDNDDGLRIVARQGETWKEQNIASGKAVSEILFDYYAANLLIPTERFILWEDKTDEEIAHKFGVDVRCIEIRREEIDHELDLMTPKDLASNVKIEESAPLTLDEMDHVLEGYSIHDIGRV